MTYKSMLMTAIIVAAASVAAASPALAQQGPMSAPQQQNNPSPSPFERADANNDGVITLADVRSARTAAFTRLDTNRDGFLVQSEMPRPPRGIDKMKPKGGGDMLGGADGNNDGNVTRAEFDAAWTRLQAAQVSAMSDRRENMFMRMDANRDGTITREEADIARAQAPNRRPENRPNADTNNDQRVSLAEWLARPDPLFERGDVNKDGRVTREEAAAVVRQGRGPGGRPFRPW